MIDLKHSKAGTAILAAAAVAVSLSLVGCSEDSKSASSSSTSSSAAATTAESSAKTTEKKSKLTPRTSEAPGSGANKTIADYIVDNDITETVVHSGDAGSPTVGLPIPDGWEDANDKAPDVAYGAILYSGPEAGEYPVTVIAIMSKLDGNVDPDELLSFARGELQNLPGFEPLAEGTKTTFNDFPAFEYGGTYKGDNGETLISAQKTVVVEGSDGTYVMQFNVDGAEAQIDVIKDVTTFIDENVTITP
ncbi:LpqN/LpqT family lipoprotein [Antrihabitans sp. YC3-6]|uniref:LpqN/LpqT family lipoprotein n=1 Tax=Antrihabitans stalagmiti TaxID=2799499 RepID=A0A934U152_9NOCA|nr:LpqN/LpqT family lipoprotein [Antrihabitans stalagmiti]MBJ8337936.1 LpqN/LpqT family lipoprotein [Antrihabitans stalagmiti]